MAKTRALLIEEIKNLQKQIADQGQLARWYHTIFENTGTATVIIEEDTTLSRVNSQFEKLAGYTREEIEGKKSWTEFVHQDDLPRMKEHHQLRRHDPDAAPRNYEFRFVDRQGNVKNIFLTVNIIPGTRRSVASLHDITGHKQAERRIKDLYSSLGAIRNVNQLITKEKNRDRLLKGTCRRLTKAMGYHRAWLALLDEQGKVMDTVQTGWGKNFLPLAERLERGELSYCIRRALAQPEPVVITDPASTCDCPLGSRYSGRGAVTARLEHGERIYGVLSLCTPPNITMDEEHQMLLREISGDIAFALHDIELEEERRQLEQETKRARDFAEAIVATVREPLVILDAELKVISANRSFYRTFKMAPEEVENRLIYELGNRQWDIAELRQLLDNVLPANTSFDNFLVSHKFPAIGQRTMRLNARQLYREGKKTQMILLAIEDVTELKRAEEKLKQNCEKLQRTLEGTIGAIAAIVEVRDPYTAGHQRRVTQLACAIAKEMGLSPEQISGIYMAGLIHDIGKICIPAEILSKPSKLTETEFTMIKTHPQVGYNILRTVEFPWPVAQIILQHHERMDGSGYPQGLSGEDILLEARILGVADVVEAMSSHRPYRPALGIDKALLEILHHQGGLYDPGVVDTCLRLLERGQFRFK